MANPQEHIADTLKMVHGTTSDENVQLIIVVPTLNLPN